MDPSGTAFDPALLLAQRAWIRRLARELAADPSAADDLAQEAWLVAAERAPAGPLLPWLRGVLKRLARQRRRERARRARREREHARPEALPATDELVQRAELQARVAEALVGLPEPYRSTLLLRYFEELDAAEIARRRGIPAATVRSQLARGLARMRVVLDERQPGGRAAWMGVVVGWLGDASESAAATSVSGLSVVGGMLAMKAMLVAAAIASGCLFWWLLASSPGAKDEPPGLSNARSERAPREEHATEGASASAAAEERASVLVRATAQGEATQGARDPGTGAAAIALARVEARIVSSSGAPLAGASLELEDPPLRAEADAGGRVALELELAGEARAVAMVARAPGFAARRIETRLAPGSRVPLGDLSLAAAGSLSGRLLDARGGAPAGVEAIATGPVPPVRDPEQLRRLGPRDPLLRGRSPGVVEGRVAADGSFHLEGVPAGPALLWAGGGDYAWSSSGPLHVRAGEELGGIELALEPLAGSDWIELGVLSPEGDPVPRAMVVTSVETPEFSKTSLTWTDERGRLRLLLEQRLPHHFEARDPEDRWSPVFVRGVAPGTHDLVLRFEEARWIEVLARRSGGDPIADFRVEGQHERLPGYWEGSGSEAQSAAGRARLRAPTLPFRVLVEARGHALATLGPFDPARVPERLLVELEELPGVHGRVVQRGEPVAGARVELKKLWPASFVHIANGFRSLVDPHSSSEATTDADGRFHLELREAGEYLLRCVVSSSAMIELGPLPLEPRTGARELELELGAGGAIEGRLVPAQGADPTGRIIALNRGDGEPRTQHLERDGRFRFEGLLPGKWQVLAPEVELDASGSVSSLGESLEPVSMDWSCEVLAGETTWFELSEQREECALEGRLALGAARLEGWSAELRREVPANEAPALELRAALDADGRFRIVAPRSGKHHLELRAPGSDRGGLELALDLDLRPGPNELSLALGATSLTGEGAPVGSRSETLLEFLGHSAEVPGLSARARIVPSADGRFSLSWVPAGSGTIQAYEPSSTPGELGQWKPLARFELAAGGVRHLRLNGP